MAGRSKSGSARHADPYLGPTRLAARGTGTRDQRHAWAYLFGAICPDRGIGAALVLPFANAEMMNLHLAEISTAVTPGAHAVLIVDGAGWHQTGDKLRVPANITLLHLPPYSPELNPAENVWAYLEGIALDVMQTTLWGNGAETSVMLPFCPGPD